MVSNKGISYEYHGDKITWIWPWKRTKEDGHFYSSLYDEMFNDLNSYWEKKGRISATLSLNKSLYFDVEYVVSDFANRLSGGAQNLVVVLNQRILALLENRDPKYIAILEKIKPERMQGLSNKNSVVFAFDTSNEAMDFMRSIPPPYGFALMISNGHLVSSNNYLALLERAKDDER